jgi:glycolate oxidase
LVDVLEQIYEIVERYDVMVLNVFHAGDGNLHPILAFDAAEPGMTDLIHAAGREIIEVSLAAGGVLSGEHGIGIEKRDFMGLQFSDADLDHQNRLRNAFDPHCRLNPGKVLPSGHTCADIKSLQQAGGDVWG